jgi:hypothetical protein
MRPSQAQLGPSNVRPGKGLEIPFDVMVLLADVELPVLVDEGVVLMGYQTALAPVSKSGGSIQWHLETSTEGQLDPYNLQSTQKQWFKALDWKHFKDMRCFTGWCSSAHINLGTTKLANGVGWPDSKVQKKTLLGWNIS